jgi:hypothetical protein
MLVCRPNNLRAMRTVYQGLSGVQVEPLHFAPQDISGERLLAMMKVDENTRLSRRILPSVSNSLDV